MGYMAKWGPKGFLVSPAKIAAIEGLMTSATLKSDSQNDTSGTAPTNTRGREAVSISFAVNYIRAAGVDPRAQKEEWESLLGKSYPFYVGGKRFGPELLTLKQVDFEITLDNNGGFVSVVASVILEEHSDGKTSKLATTNDAASRAASVYAATVAKKKAMSTTASAADKARLSPYVSMQTLN